MINRKIPLILVLVLICLEVTAQSRISGTGVQFGSIIGQTNLPDNEYNLYARAFIRQDFSMAFQGEASLGLGFINGIQYQTRLVPLEYRLHYKPYKGRKLWAFNNMNFEPFLFTGFGALYYSPVEVSAGDDPLTVEAGPSLPGSSYWDHSRGFTGFIPVGGGVEIDLDQNAQLVLTAGYNQSLSNTMTGLESGFANGYWGLTAGIKLSRPKPKKTRLPVVARVYQPDLHVRPTLETLKPASSSIEYSETDLISSIDLRDILFHTLSAELINDYQPGLNRIRRILERDESIRLKVHGHTDSIGEDRLNNTLSDERAWTAGRFFIENGIDPDRIETYGHGPDDPVADNATEEGRSLNRRIEIEAYRADLNDEGPLKTTARTLPAVEKMSLLVSPGAIRYEWLTNNFIDNSEDEIEALAGTLLENPDWEILIVSSVSKIKSLASQQFLSSARAEKIRRELMQYGIPYGQIHTARFDEVPVFDGNPISYISFIPYSSDQQTAIIRIR
ncbi:MAG: OmpA family protein [Balneolales bacterium]